MKFTFSIRDALKKSWNHFAKHPFFFGALAFVMVIFSAFSQQHQSGTAVDNGLTILVVIASIIWSYVWISASLAAIDGHDDILNLRFISQHMPSVRQFFVMVGVGLLVGLIVACGFILLIIPGVYLLIRLAFANTAVVDRQQGVGASMKYSWKLVEGKIFWTVFVVGFVELVLIIVGAIPAGIGLLITYPIAMLLMTQLYRDLTVYHRSVQEHSEQVV